MYRTASDRRAYPSDRCKSVADRMARYSDQSGGEDSCWPWQATRSARGYGRVCVGLGRMDWAHRVSWEQANGPIPAGGHVLHRCDNPSCVNPAHLFLGDQATNMADMTLKGRTKSHLSAKDVELIRLLCGRIGCTQAEVARRYGVARSTVSAITRRETWTHVGEGAV